MQLSGSDRPQNTSNQQAPSDQPPNDDWQGIIFKVTTAVSDFFQKTSLWLVDLASWVEDRVFELLPTDILKKWDLNRSYVNLMARNMTAQERSAIIKAVSALPQSQETSGILADAISLFTPNMDVSSKISLIKIISELEPNTRFDIMLDVYNFINIGNSRKHMNANEELQSITDAIVMMSNLDQLKRTNLIQETRGEITQAATDGHINRHDRDWRVRAAMELLRAGQQQITEDEITQALQEFESYLDTKRMNNEDKELAKTALLKPQGETESFGPLISETDFSIAGLNLSGKEVIGRLWIFASNLTEPEQTNAKIGMISALKNSYDDTGERICNQGKTQSLAIAVLQGRLKGVNIELTQKKKVSAAEALNLFFANEAHRSIKELPLLINAAKRFYDESTLIADQKGFLNEITEYAKRSF